VSINTRVRDTSESVVDDTEVQDQGYRTHRVHEVTSQLNVPTSLTPTPNHLLRFYLVGCAKEVSRLINRPVVSLFGTRVSGTGANMITESVNDKLFATTSRERTLRQCRYCCTDTRGKDYLTEARRPDLISVMSPDLPQPTHGLIPKEPPRGVLFF
jgi:hypothetical protein